MKTRGNSKMFKCLRPVTTDDGLLKQSKPCSSVDVTKTDRQRGLEHSSGSEQGEGRGDDGGTAAGYPKILTLLSIRKSESSDGGFAADNPSIRKEKSRGKFGRVLKAVFFEASLSRKIRRTESFLLGSSRSRSSCNLSSKTQKISNCRNESCSSKECVDPDKFSRIGSDCSSLLSSSLMTLRDSASLSSSGSCSSLSLSTSGRKRQLTPVSLLERREQHGSVTSRTKENIERGRYHGNVGCCLILCLLVLVFWGKALAIFCISAWLYVAPLCFKGVTDSSKIDPGECRTKVMVEEPAGISHGRRM